MTETGDRIILRKSDGTCDLLALDESGERIQMRQNLPSLHQAWEIARGSLTGTRIWVCDEETPDVLKSY
jgi:hypothetical protein